MAAPVGKLSKSGEKKNLEYSVLANWIRSKISFTLLKSAIPCIRGSRDLKSSPDLNFDDIELIEYMQQSNIFTNVMRLPFAIKTVPTVDNICCLVDRWSQLPEVAILLNILFFFFGISKKSGLLNVE